MESKAFSRRQVKGHTGNQGVFLVGGISHSKDAGFCVSSFCFLLRPATTTTMLTHVDDTLLLSTAEFKLSTIFLPPFEELEREGG